MLPLLRTQLETSYGMEPEFTKTWDRLQVDSKCCGISGPLDYNKTAFGESKTQLSVPATCCHPSQTHPLQLLSATSKLGSENLTDKGYGGLNQLEDFLQSDEPPTERCAHKFIDIILSLFIHSI